MTLLEQFKLTIGDMNNSLELDDYYNNFLTLAQGDLITDDVSEENLTNTDIGKATIILYAIDLMNGKSPSDNNTINNLRAKLSIITRGDRYVE